MRGKIVKEMLIEEEARKKAAKSREAYARLFPYVKGSFERCREGDHFLVAWEHYDDLFPAYVHYKRRAGKSFIVEMVVEKQLYKVTRIK